MVVLCRLGVAGLLVVIGLVLVVQLGVGLCFGFVVLGFGHCCVAVVAIKVGLGV